MEEKGGEGIAGGSVEQEVQQQGREKGFLYAGFLGVKARGGEKDVGQDERKEQEGGQGIQQGFQPGVHGWLLLSRYFCTKVYPIEPEK
jgi:hypothetical protein